MTEPVRTVRSTEIVYGARGAALDDPADVFHEASKAYPQLLATQLPGVRNLLASRELQVSAQRSVRSNRELPAVPLPQPAPLTTSFDRLLIERRSTREFAGEPVTQNELAALLRAGYGITRGDREAQSFRSVPSGGALYPLELYPVVGAVEGLGEGIYRFDPLRECIELVRGDRKREELAAASVYPEIVGAAGITILVVAVFWRTRFKYALRGYRFALLEAGHVVQNILLAAASLGLAAVPLGGYYDRRVDDMLRLDGVDESTIYAVCVGKALEDA